jgi:DNA-binding transcriptional MerR regulator
MEKSPDAFRTISEVADWLGVPTHVLRFWESRFSQVKPVKRAGGRRYYRPNDMLLLGGIKRLLHDDGMTIRGVQKMLREEGVKHVAGFSQPLESEAPMKDITPETEDVAPSPMAVDVEPEPLDNVVPMAPTAKAPDAQEEDAEDAAPAEPEADEAAADEETVPELAFLHRSEPAAEADAPPQGELFSSRRSAVPPPQEAAPEPPRPAIPDTPDVPVTDPEDDDPAFPAHPRIAARLRGLPAHRLKIDAALAARTVSELRAIRERL